MKRKDNGTTVQVNDVFTRTVCAKEYRITFMNMESLQGRLETFYTAGKISSSALHKKAEAYAGQNEVVVMVSETGNTIEKLYAITIDDFLSMAFEVER